MLGSLLGVPGFELGSAEEVRTVALNGVDIAARLSNAPGVVSAGPAVHRAAIQRIAEVPIYSADALVRRSPPLQATADAAAPVAGMPGSLMERLGVRDGDLVRVAQDGGEAVLPAVLDERVPAGCVRIPAGHPLTADLGGMFGAVELSRVPAPERATV